MVSSSSSPVSPFFLVPFLVSCLPFCVDSRGGERIYGFAGLANHSYEPSARHLLVHELNQSVEVYLAAVILHLFTYAGSEVNACGLKVKGQRRIRYGPLHYIGVGMGTDMKCMSCQFPKTKDVGRGYMTNHELEKAMKEFTYRCASISRIYSVMGVPLWVLEISDKPGQEEPEPAFKFIGNVHGDEPVGRELLVLLANWLCDNHRKDPLASLIIKNVHLHLLPTMNPDGFSLKRRGNANNVDLNRDFPDQFFPQNDDEHSRQPETMAIMNWLKERRFTASASLHGGALVANYPWDGSKDLRKQYYACPDDKAFRHMASLYSRFHYNMSQSHEFQEGITNGAAWYPIYGGMQDWNYIHGGCFELTLEISDVKWPRAEELPVLWNYNRASMLNLIASILKTGVHGRIFSALSGQPLPAAVDIKGINYTVSAGQLFGYYHRLLAPGQTYEVTASMPGYLSKTARISTEDEAVNVDFILISEDGEPSKLRLAGNNCKYSCGSMQKSELTLVLTKSHLEVSIAVFAILGFLMFLFRRRINFRVPKSRQVVTHKRVLVP